MSKRKKDEILYYVRHIIVIILIIIAAICYINNTLKKQKELEEQFSQLQEENITLTEQNENITKVIATIKARYDIDECPICGSNVIIECTAKDFRVNCPNCGLHTEYVESIEKVADIWQIIVNDGG